CRVELRDARTHAVEEGLIELGQVELETTIGSIAGASAHPWQRTGREVGRVGRQRGKATEFGLLHLPEQREVVTVLHKKIGVRGKIEGLHSAAGAPVLKIVPGVRAREDE